MLLGLRLSLRLGATLLLASSVATCGESDPDGTPEALTLVSGDAQIGGAGEPLTLPLVVRVTDRSGDPVTNVVVRFTIASGNGSLTASSATTGTTGNASVTWTLGGVPGEVSAVRVLTATLPRDSVEFTATVVAGPASQIVTLQGDAQSAEVGTPVPQPVLVEARDRFGNLIMGRLLSWIPDSGGGQVPTPTMLTDGQGRATSSWTLGHVYGPGSQRLRATLDGFDHFITASTALPAGTMRIVSGNDQLGLPGTTLAATLVVEVLAADGIGVELAPLQWQTQGGSLSAVSPTDQSGRATAAWHLDTLAGAQTAQVDAPALTPTSLTFSATAVVPAGGTIIGNILTPAASLRWSRRTRRTLQSFGEIIAPDGAGGGAQVRDYRSAATVPGELLVSFKPSVLGALVRSSPAVLSVARSQASLIRSRLAAHLATGQVVVRGVSPVIRTARLQVTDPARTDSVMRALAQDPMVLAVQRSSRIYLDDVPLRATRLAVTVPNDPNYPNQSWHYSMVDLPRAWSITTGSAGVIVAVLDNGVRFDHPAIGVAGGTYLTGGGNLRNDGYDFVSTFTIPLCGGGSVDNAGDAGDGIGDGYDPDPSIPDDRLQGGGCLGARDSLGGHGLHVAGTIGATGNDGYSVVGVNWNVSIRPVRVIGLESGTFYDIAQGMLYAAGLPADDGQGGVLTPPAQPARIINLSLGGSCLAGPNPAPGLDPMHDAVVAVTDPTRPGGGTLVVVSAGNNQTSVPPCPAGYPEVMAVAAVGPAGTRADYSNFGPWISLAAPGGETAAPDATYWVFSSVCNFAVYPAPCVPRQARLPGTSMAAPHVTGIAALLLAQNPGLTAAQLRSRLENFATPTDPSQQLGAGIVNARNALTQTLTPARQVYARAIDASTGAVVATVPATTGGGYTISGLPPGNYYVAGGEDESGDGVIGVPDRRYALYGGSAAPAAVAVSAGSGGFAALTLADPAEVEPNDVAATATSLLLGGSVRGALTGADQVDWYRVLIPSGGLYTFETAGWFGDRCSFALDLNTTLELLDSGQSSIATSVDIDVANNDFCSRISTTLSAGVHYLRVTRGDFFGFGPHSGRYALWARSGP
ncbi:MAG: S8 family serine peptidase [Gemmatimonadales bacterium]